MKSFSILWLCLTRNRTVQVVLLLKCCIFSIFFETLETFFSLHFLKNQSQKHKKSQKSQDISNRNTEWPKKATNHWWLTLSNEKARQKKKIIYYRWCTNLCENHKIIKFIFRQYHKWMQKETWISMFAIFSQRLKILWCFCSVDFERKCHLTVSARMNFLAHAVLKPNFRFSERGQITLK